MVAITIMVAGNETTTNLIGNTVVELLANPDQLKLLLDDPGLLPNAVDEANRLTNPPIAGVEGCGGCCSGRHSPITPRWMRGS
jgi:cytochrome P450